MHTHSVPHAVTNVGVHLDRNMTQECHAVKYTSSYYQVRRIRQMRPFVDDNALRTTVHSLVTSRIDYCNSLPARCGGPSKSSRVFSEYIQNNAARLICDQPHHCYVNFTGYPYPAEYSESCVSFMGQQSTMLRSYLTELYVPCL